MTATYSSSAERKGKLVSLREFASEVMRILETIDERKREKVDLDLGKKGVVSSFYMNVDGMTDEL